MLRFEDGTPSKLTRPSAFYDDLVLSIRRPSTAAAVLDSYSRSATATASGRYSQPTYLTKATERSSLRSSMAYATSKDYTALAYPLSPIGSPKSAADDWKIGSSLAEVRHPALHVAPCCMCLHAWNSLLHAWNTISRLAHSKKVPAVKQLMSIITRSSFATAL